ncbi:hypothetical protein [Gorillibacterium sp. sgz500922]|uniref:hypothetical protein n=1 Tax=Gorillibacterium sp. sgz500922 TaxID=3446694 RepID=UPI003F67C883
MIPFSEEVARQRRQDLEREAEVHRLRKGLKQSAPSPRPAVPRRESAGFAAGLNRLCRQLRSFL